MAATANRVEAIVGGRKWIVDAVVDQDALLADVKDDAQLATFPYGLLLWPSASALATWIDRDRSQLPGKRVLEIGCGIGLAGLVAASHGASVTQTDWQDPVLALARRAAEINCVGGIETRLADWRAWPSDLHGFDWVIGSDVLYERSVHEPLTELLSRLVRDGSIVRLTDPLRPQAFDILDRWEKEGRFRIDLESLTANDGESEREILGIRLAAP